MNAPACVRCGQPITPGARFCTRCGSDVSGEQGNVATARLPSVPAEEGSIEILRRATLGEYEILAELGRGGMATVYLAHEISLDRKVAIKVMAPQLMFGEGMAERFRREARTAASLSHPHIIPIFAVKESGRVLYFVMKFVAGRPLDDIIREVGPLPIPMVRAILSQVGSALGYAHRRGIIHRDIKPANIMIDDEGWAVVTDFGIAKVAETQGLTMTGVAVGTPSYMSPEQCAAKEVTGRSDQYSLGIVAYEMITGKQPFVADTAMAIMWQHFNDPPRPIREHRAECPPEIEAAVLRMMEKQPDRRWPSIEDAMGALGSSPLAHDDPVRLRMVGLAKSSLNQRLLDEMKTPTSLVPPTRSSNKQATEMIAGVGSVAVSPRSANLAAGDTLQLSVLVQDLKGDTIAGRTVQWSSTSPALATVTAGGLVTAIAPGQVTITGSCEGQTAQCELTISPVAVAAVVVAPAIGSLEAGDTLQLSATLRDAQGKPVTGRSVVWTSSAPALAGVSADGLVAGSIPGTARITATCEGKAGASSVTVTAAPVSSITLEPSALSLQVGGMADIGTIVRDGRGRVVAGRPVSWQSQSPAIATVSDTGIVKALAAGTAHVAATCEGKTATLVVTIAPIPVAAIEITSPPKSIEVSESRQLTAQALTGDGKRLERPIIWRSTDATTIRVSTSGEITGLKEGVAEVIASSEEKRAAISIRVVPVPVATVALSPANVGIKAGERTQLAALIRDARGKAVEGRTVTWSSSKPSIASVSSSGLVTAIAAGNTIVTAAVEGKKATADVRIAAAPIAAPPVATVIVKTPPEAAPVSVEAATAKMTSIDAPPRVTEPAPTYDKALAAHRETKSRLPLLVGAVVLVAVALGLWRFGPWAKSTAVGPAVSISASPASPVLNVGDSVEMSAVYHDSSNLAISGGPGILWTVDNPTVAVVSGNWVRAVSGGTATVLASGGGLQASAVLTVNGASASGHATVGSVAVGHLPDVFTLGETVQLTAEVKGADGEVLAGKPVSWTSSNPAVVAVTPAGQVTAKSEGTVSLTAMSEGKSATATLTVTPASVASVQVTPSRSSLEVAGTVRLSAQARDGKGNVLDGRNVTWTSSNPSVASVGDDGTVKAGSVGSATIVAATGGKSGSASVSVVVTRVDVAAVAISPNGGELTAGDRLQLQAELKDVRGSVVRDRTPEWSSSNADVATVSPAGLVTAVGAGTVNILASSDGRQASVRVLVTRVAVAALTVSSPPSSLPVGQSFRLIAGVRDGRGNLLSDRVVSWTSTNSQVAAVSPDGLVNAVGQGTARISATSEGKSVTATIVVPKPVTQVAAVVVAPATASLEPGGTIQLSAIPQDARGTAMDRPVVWSTSNAAIATVSRTGLVSASDAGTATITATSDSRSAPVAITVTARATPDVGTQPPPNPNAGGAIPRMSIAAGGAFTCGLLSGGAVACWGSGIQSPTPLPSDLRLSRISAGTSHACGLTSAGEAWCWGNNMKGQMGDGTTNNTRATPVAVVGGLSFRLIRAGGKHTCGLTSGGKAYCWGDNSSGQLGDGTTSGHTRPVPVPDLTFSDLSAGGSHTCGIATGGKTYCWGDGFSGQLGYGQLSTESSPVDIGGSVQFVKIYAGGTHTCGLTGAGKAYCWGDNRASQLGDGSGTDRTKPVEVLTGPAFEELSLGASHSCGRTGAGIVYCWGANAKGQLGDGTRGNRARPGRVQGDGPFISISAGGAHTCAATSTQAFCWGENAKGQLGDGSLVAKPTPVAIGRVGN